MENIKIVSTKIFLAIGFSILMLISSCSDDKTVTHSSSEEELDTNCRYNWDYDELSGFWFDKMYVADSSNIFITGNPAPLYFNGIDYSPIAIPDPNFSAFSIDGYDKNNVFIGGVHLNNTFGVAQLAKLEGQSIILYPELDDSTGTINDLQIDGPNEVWFGVSEKNYVYRFSSGQFAKYTVDTGTESGVTFRSNNGNLFFFTFKREQFQTYLYSYIFQNNLFQRIKIDTVCLACKDPFLIHKSQDLLLKVDNRSIFYFNENDWVKICDTQLLQNSWWRLTPQAITGSSKDNLIIYSLGPYAPIDMGIFVRSENKWSWERSLSFNLPTHIDIAADMKVNDDKVYLALRNSNSVPFSILLKGNLKIFKK